MSRDKRWPLCHGDFVEIGASLWSSCVFIMLCSLVSYFRGHQTVALLRQLKCNQYLRLAPVVDCRRYARHFLTGSSDCPFPSSFFTFIELVHCYCPVFSLCCFHPILLQPSLSFYGQIANHVPVSRPTVFILPLRHFFYFYFNFLHISRINLFIRVC